MRFPTFLIAAATAFATSGALAEPASPLSQRIAEDGLAKTQMHLLALPAPSDDELFALGGVAFLRGIEQTLQMRYRVNAGTASEIPLLRLPVPPNPEPAPFEAEMIAEIFRTALAGFETVDKALAEIEGEVGLSIDLGDLWFDVNGNGARERGEGLFAVTGAALGANQTGAELVVRFDTADVAWLRAYAHLLAGISEVVLAYDPTEAISTVTEASAALGPNMIIGSQDFVDQAAIILLALRQEPDAARTRKALGHFETMIAQNRIFWNAVARETDDAAEWIPNARQTSALGLTVPQEVADSWQAILDEGDAVLNGETVLPYWRLQRKPSMALSGDGTGTQIRTNGINLRRMFTDPAPVDLVLWIQGAGALPYLKQGRLANSRNWRNFSRLLGGDAPLFALWLN